ncbi:nucleotide phosphate derivative pyrophosphohydrolase [Catenovulum agarivorans DS-2]|uniref:NAD-capped RNA hydrolase NudC n=1 Tax=Catenovulum agarivorans DS-2 TaxID=1328313 RepID=W7QBU6_9ALTE|nr:NAD(+) diphosphatase [Catenovulum agarivorans]EWH10329.1 nucleotide phosphate derivative pyrophosphohydrolase [Catenovulum agarivorans DS-2]
MLIDAISQNDLTSNAYWLVVRQDELWLLEAAPWLPFGKADDLFVDYKINKVMVVGEHNGHPVYMVNEGAVVLAAEYPAEFCEFRELITQTQLEQHLFSIAAKAIQFQHFLATHKYCGRCGKRMTPVSWELAMHCKHCRHRCYPRLSPCVIMAVLKDKQLLLARGKKSRSGKFSILAGFVEPGETLEHAVAREVKEEVGVEIKNIRYVGSQPWPFPHQIMVGFVADHLSGEINIDEQEIAEAAWYTLDNLPETPGEYSIAGRMIGQLVENYLSDGQ